MDINPLDNLFTHIPWYRALWWRVLNRLALLNPLRAWQNLCDFIQRGRRGYAAYDWINLSDYLAPIILGCLKQMRAKSMAYPTDLTPEEWDASLDKMILAFQAVVDDAPDWCASAEFVKGFAEFYYRYPDLWD